jgi:ABC-type transporter Mla subunit MlaD
VAGRGRLALYEAAQPALRDALAAADSVADGGGLAPRGARAGGADPVALAQKAAQLRQANDELRAAVRRAEERVAALEAQLRDANRLLDSTHHPHQLLVQTVRARDEELQAQREHAERLRVMVSTVTADRDRLREQCETLKADVERLAANRESSNHLHAAVAELRERQRASLARVAHFEAQPGAPPAPLAIEGGAAARGAAARDAPPPVWFTKLRQSAPRRPGA